MHTHLVEESLTKIAQEAEPPSPATMGHVGTPDTGRGRAGRASPLTRHLSKTVLGLGMIGVLGLVPVQKLSPTLSVEAVINARVVTLSAPIDGEVRTSPGQFGARFAPGDLLLHVVNDRADRSRVDDLGYEIQRLNDERPGIVARLAEARMRLADLTEQLRLFTESRTLQLDARQDELKAELAAAQAKNEEAGTTLERFSTLAGKGWTSRAQLNQARRDGSIAEKSQAAAEKRLEAVGVELAAARRGVFVGIGSNDRPRYMQRADQLEQQVSNLAETLAERDQRLVRLNEQIVLEKIRYGLMAAADIVAPARGRIWEASASQGQHVRRGEELLRVLDCDRPVVTALISDAIYSRLKVGSSARFLPHGGRIELSGQIIQLTRVSPSHVAIQPPVGTSGTYHVTVSVLKLAEEEGCMVGRTGQLNFDESPSEIAAAAKVSALR
jgi:multidrug resistance efflux pump